MIKTKTKNHTLYSPGSPFEGEIDSESCMITMLYGACVALGRVSANDMSVKDFIACISVYAYKRGSWQHRGIGKFLSTIGVNFLSIDTENNTCSVSDMIESGRLNKPETASYIREILEGTKGDELTRFSRKLLLTLDGHTFWGMKQGVNGYTGKEKSRLQHYIGYLRNLPDVGVEIWDPDEKPYYDVLGLRPSAMSPASSPGVYTVDHQWVQDHFNGNIIVVWTDKSRQSRARAYAITKQLDPDIQIESRDLFLTRENDPIVPRVNKRGLHKIILGGHQAFFTYGENVKSRDGNSELTRFGHKIETDGFILPNMGGHTSKVSIIRGDELVKPKKGIAYHSNNPERSDAIIAINQGLPICIPGADCPIYVGAGRLRSGEEITFGAHSGQIGMLRGLNQNLIQSLKSLGVEKKSLSILIGPGAHTLELDLPYIELYDRGVHNWRSSIVREYVGEDGVQRVIVNLVASVIDALSHLGDLMAEPPKVVMSNTLADPNVWSERAMSMHGSLPSKSNAVVVF